MVVSFCAFSFQIINTYTEAVQTVDPFKATGKTHTLWVSFAKFYETNGQIEDVSDIVGWKKALSFSLSRHFLILPAAM